MNMDIEIDFTTPGPIRQDEGAQVWRVVNRFHKLLGWQDTYSVSMTADTDDRIEDVVGDAMDRLRKALPGFNPYEVRAVAVHVTATAAAGAANSGRARS